MSPPAPAAKSEPSTQVVFAKRVIKGVLRWAGVPSPIDSGRIVRNEAAINDLVPAVQGAQGLATEVDARLAAVEAHLPELLNTIASSAGALRLMRRENEHLLAEIGAANQHIEWLEQFRDEVYRAELENLAAGIRESWDRIETVRLETLLELRYGKGGPAAEVVESPGVVSAAKVTRAIESGEVRLNLGCGHLPLDGYLNVDARALPDVDIVAGIDDLPFDEGQLDEIFSADVLEHFPQELLARRLLPYWAQLLRPGGTLRAVVPDGAALVHDYAAGAVRYEDFRKVVFGGQEYEGDFHYSMFTAEALTALLNDAGFVDVVVEAEGRMNDVCPELQISARRPS